MVCMEATSTTNQAMLFRCNTWLKVCHEIPTLGRRRTPRATGTKGRRRPATSPSQGRAGRTSRSEHGAIRVIDNGGLQGLACGGCLIEAGVDVTVNVGRLTF